MKYILTCIPGLEQFAIQETKELIKKTPKILIPGRLITECSEKDIQTLIYQTHSLIYIYELLEQGTISDIEDIKKLARKIKYKNIIRENFVVRCDREGQHLFHSVDVEKAVGSYIYENEKIPVDLNNPTTTIYIDIKDKNCFIGVDMTGIKLSKRDYRIKLTAININPCIAYSMIRFADYNPKESLLDPFTRSGEIPIEAALYALNVSPQKHIKENLLIAKLQKANFKDKEKKFKTKIYAVDEMMPHIRNTEINSKLAGVNKYINFSRIELEWLDTKFKKNSIDKIITYPPQVSASHPEEQLERIYSTFFKQADYILKKSGSIVLLLNTKTILYEKYINQYKFKITKTVSFSHANFDYLMLEARKA